MSECDTCGNEVGLASMVCVDCLRKHNIEEQRRGRVEELEYVLNVTNLGGISIENKIIEIHRYCENKLEELQGVEKL